jgi:hypothetical protein
MDGSMATPARRYARHVDARPSKVHGRIICKFRRQMLAIIMYCLGRYNTIYTR